MRLCVEWATLWSLKCNRKKLYYFVCFHCRFTCGVAVIMSALNGGDWGSIPHRQTVFSHRIVCYILLLHTIILTKSAVLGAIVNMTSVHFISYLCHTDDHRGGVGLFSWQAHCTPAVWGYLHNLDSNGHECNDMLLYNSLPGDQEEEGTCTVNDQINSN